jgi:DNA-binding IclR family transcriptional regulator
VAYKAFAKESGWPDDLRPRAVQILNLLASHGMPLTRKQIAEKIGMPWKGSRKSLHSNDKEGSYLANLQARGLVIKLGKIANTNCGRGSGVSLYTLGPKALSILQQRASNEQ